MGYWGHVELGLNFNVLNICSHCWVQPWHSTMQIWLLTAGTLVVILHHYSGHPTSLFSVLLKEKIREGGSKWHPNLPNFAFFIVSCWWTIRIKFQLPQILLSSIYWYHNDNSQLEFRVWLVVRKYTLTFIELNENTFLMMLFLQRIGPFPCLLVIITTIIIVYDFHVLYRNRVPKWVVEIKSQRVYQSAHRI